jgi:hypothetical protein
MDPSSHFAGFLATKCPYCGTLAAPFLESWLWKDFPAGFPADKKDPRLG